MKKNIIISGVFLLALVPSFSQTEEKEVDLNGYVSTINSAMFESLKDNMILDNLLHNRLNFKAYLNPKLTFAAEARNRLFLGDMVRLNSGYREIISADGGFADMSWNIASENSFFLNTTIDRLWLDYNSGKFQARVGRQRINWGQALVWNPNDIFNAYSYFDFDYIERPGSDAVRLQYYPQSSSVIELAIKAERERDITAAALYRFNKWGYDIQFLSGVLQNNEFVAGIGWSGAIGSVSFRGEGTLFEPFGKLSDSTSTGMLTIGFDKFFANNAAIQAQAIVCNNPFNPPDLTDFYTSDMSVKDLAFSKFTLFGSYSYPVTPLFTSGISGMWFPDRKGFFTGLSADYSIAGNVDLSMLWQHFEGTFGSVNRSSLNLAFLRIKLSF